MHHARGARLRKYSLDTRARSGWIFLMEILAMQRHRETELKIH